MWGPTWAEKAASAGQALPGDDRSAGRSLPTPRQGTGDPGSGCCGGSLGALGPLRERIARVRSCIAHSEGLTYPLDNCVADIAIKPRAEAR